VDKKSAIYCVFLFNAGYEDVTRAIVPRCQILRR
jgi:hypothetical protein